MCVIKTFYTHTPITKHKCVLIHTYVLPTPLAVCLGVFFFKDVAVDKHLGELPNWQKPKQEYLLWPDLRQAIKLITLLFNVFWQSIPRFLFICLYTHTYVIL